MAYMRFEQVRLSTFEGWENDFISPFELSRCGFFLRNNRIICAFCQVNIHHWMKKNIPMDMHYRCCPFAEGYTDNVPLYANPLDHSATRDVCGRI